MNEVKGVGGCRKKGHYTVPWCLWLDVIGYVVKEMSNDFLEQLGGKSGE